LSDDPYKVLGIPRDATHLQVKRAYLRLVRQFTPEENPREFQAVRRAYELLRDEKKRAELDLFDLGPQPEVSWDARPEPPVPDPRRELARVIFYSSELVRDDFPEDRHVFQWEGTREEGKGSP
jgi:curved DNA-binding protein CbpA